MVEDSFVQLDLTYKRTTVGIAVATHLRVIVRPILSNQQLNILRGCLQHGETSFVFGLT